MSGIRVTYSGLISLSGGVIAVIASMVFTVLVTRKLLPEEYGAWGVISGVLMYVVLIGTITSFWTTREISRGRYVGKTQIIGTSFLTVPAVIAYLLISFFLDYQTDVKIEHLLLASFLIPTNLFVGALQAINLGKHPQVISYGNLAFGISQIPNGIIFIYFLNMGIDGVILAVIISQIISILVLTFFAKDYLVGSFQYNILKKWFSLSWISLYPSIGMFLGPGLQITIFTIITGSLVGVAYWVASIVVIGIISLSGLMSTAVYPKLLEGNNKSFIQSNLTHLFFVGILFTVIAISFGKHALFVLNPIYVDAYPVVIILSIGGFLVVIINLFKQMLTAVETVDLNEKSTKSEYLKSKLFTIHTAQNIASVITIILLVIGLIVLSKINATDLNYLEYWAFVELVLEISFFFYLYIRIKRIFDFKFETVSILKYILVSAGVFGSLNYVSEIFLNYQSGIFDFVLILLIIMSVGIFAYLLINYLIDRRSRELINSIITELKHISK